MTVKIKQILKIIFYIILINSFENLNAEAHISHYKNLKKIEMEIFRNDKLIGYNYYFFKKNKDTTLVTNQIKFAVNILGATMFEVEGYGEELYNGDQLISFNSKTTQNKKEKFVKLTLDNSIKKFKINGSSYTGNADLNNVVGNWWSHELLQADSQISAISGSIKKQIVTFIGKEKIELYGKTYNAEHFRLVSKDNLPDNKKLDFQIWYNKKNKMILKVSYSRMGKWEYRLKNFE